MATLAGTRPLKRDRFPDANGIFHVSWCTERRVRYLEPLQAGRAVVHALRASDADALTETLTYVVLADQVHWLFVLGDFVALSRPVRQVKQASEAAIRRTFPFSGPLWQPAFAEVPVSDLDAAAELARQLVMEPVRRRQSPAAGAWPHWDTRFASVLEAVAAH